MGKKLRKSINASAKKLKLGSVADDLVEMVAKAPQSGKKIIHFVNCCLKIEKAGRP